MLLEIDTKNMSINKPKETGKYKIERDEKGRIKQGFTGNPNGRPKGSVSVVSVLKSKLEEVPEGQQKTYLELLVAQMLKKAIAEGDVSMIKDIINRIDGMPKQDLNIEGDREYIVNIITDGKNDKAAQISERSVEKR